MIVADTEDDSASCFVNGEQVRSGFDKKVTQIAAIAENGKRFNNSGNTKDFLKWCHSVEAKPDIWFFNTAYDIGNLCNGHRVKLDDFDITMVKGRFIKGTIQGLNFYDVHNISGNGSSVGSLGLAVDLPKFGYDYSADDLKKFSPRRVSEWRGYDKTGEEKYNDPRYFFRDCEIPLKFLKFVKEKCLDMGIPKIPATLGSLCVKAFYASGGENWHEASDDSQNALRGARVELFNTGGKGRIAYTDINSLYPHCLTMLFPECVEKLDDLDGFGIAKCDVEIPDDLFVAPLPWRVPDTQQLIFPVGRISGVWTIHELRNALAVGCKIRKLKWVIGSKTGKPYYREYILENYQRRLASKSPAENLFWKLLMNNLYGRLAISGEISRSLNLTEENCHDGVPYGRKILASHRMPLPEFSNYLHAAYVLSYARITLYNFLKKIPPKDLIYCDTDSTIFFCKDKLPFPVGKELGQMKLETMGSEMIPVLPKTYVFDGKYKAKGVPKGHAKDFIDHGIAEYASPFKMRESIRFFDQDNERKLSVWRMVQKLRKGDYDRKRRKGNYFLPLIIKEW